MLLNKINKIKLILFTIVFLTPSLIYSQDVFFEKPENISKRDQVVAEVGNIPITSEEFIYSYEFGPAFPKRMHDSKKTHLNYMINEKLIALAAYDENLMEDVNTKDIYADLKGDLSAEEMFRREIVPQIKINDAEIEKVIKTKQKEYQLRWLYTNDFSKVENYLSTLREGISFDSLFVTQLNDSVHIDDRQMESSLFSIYQKNPQFGQIVDTLKPGTISSPIHTDDGWYIVKIDNIWDNLITSETDYNKLKYESAQAVTQSKMGILSDKFINSLFVNEEPVIKRDAFNVLRSYLGKFILDSEKYKNWQLDDKIDIALNNLGLKKGDKFSDLVLVTGKKMDLSINDFIVWYKNRENYIKISTNNIQTFSQSLEKYVWLMVRDKLIVKDAENKGYDKSEWVDKQAKWWEDKIAYSTYRNKLTNSITLTSEELNLINENKKSQSEIMSDELSKKLLHKILELKKKYKVKIYNDVLNEIKVSDENDKRAIDMYIVKRGNLFPRPPYPTIDKDWENWE